MYYVDLGSWISPQLAFINTNNNSKTINFTEAMLASSVHPGSPLLKVNLEQKDVSCLSELTASCKCPDWNRCFGFA